jgi:multidrug efflux pump subunit AcrB
LSNILVRRKKINSGSGQTITTSPLSRPEKKYGRPFMIGIVLGHWMMDAYFTATSLVGFIALAGVIVRNSVLLIDFIDMRLKEGTPVKQAIIEAGAVRITPILLTAGAVVVGTVIILFDPAFQGLAISLMGGTITSTFLTLLVVPLIYFKLLKKSHKATKAQAFTKTS